MIVVSCLDEQSLLATSHSHLNESNSQLHLCKTSQTTSKTTGFNFALQHPFLFYAHFVPYFAIKTITCWGSDSRKQFQKHRRSKINTVYFLNKNKLNKRKKLDIDHKLCVLFPQDQYRSIMIYKKHFSKDWSHSAKKTINESTRHYHCQTKSSFILTCALVNTIQKRSHILQGPLCLINEEEEWCRYRGRGDLATLARLLSL